MTAFLARIIGHVLAFIYSLVNNYGLSVILLTLLVRLLLLPLYAKQNKYSAAMNDLQPKIKEIQERYAADRTTMSEKMNEVYAEANISPLSGCLPLLIQMPIILGLFALLRNPLLYVGGINPAMISAVHESFLWIPDLCQPDAWILPIIAGITTYFTTAQTPDTTGSMKMMTYFFPVMIFLFGRSYAAGLSLYWAVGNFFSMIQTWVFKKNKKKTDREKEINQEVQKRMKKSR